MNLDKYVQDATRTESKIDKVTLSDPELFAYALKTFIASGNILDCFKKNVFYGKDTQNEMYKWTRAIQYYQYQIQRIDSEPTIDPRVFHALIGIATEAAELMEALDKTLSDNEDMDYVNVLEEFGDINWYEAIGVDAISSHLDGGRDFESVLTVNIDKLKKRFPEKFTNEEAINRNLEEERKILEDDSDFRHGPCSDF